MKKSMILINYLLVSTLFVVGQETKFKIRESKGVYEEFHVLQDNKKVKEGTYVKYMKDLFGRLFIIETGFYKNNLKNGCWQAFSGNQVREILNYKDGILNGEYYSFYIDTIGVKASGKISDNRGYKNDSLLLSINEEFKYLKESGQYNNNERHGVWNFYDMDGTIFFSYDFTIDTLLIDDADIESRNLVNNLSLPNYKGGGITGLSREMSSILLNTNFKDSINYNCHFTINSEGNLQEVKINSETIPKHLSKKISKKVKLKYNWIIPDLKDSITSFNFNYKIRKDDRFLETELLLEE